MRHAFIDPVTRVLMCHGFVAANEPGQLAIPVPDDFALAPGQWVWDGAVWVAFTPPPPPPSLRSRLKADVAADPSVPLSVKRLLETL